MEMGRITRDIYIRERNGRAGKDAGKVKGLRFSGSGCVFCLNPGVRVCLTSVARGGSPCTRIRVSSLPHVALPVEQVLGIWFWSITSHSKKLLEITPPGASKTRGRPARRCSGP